MSATAPTIDVEELYRATAREASIVEVPAMHFLMVDETGNTNEPYLGDPRQSAPERLKTLIRQPVSRS